MIEKNRFFIKSRRVDVTWRGGSGENDGGNDLR